MTFRFVLLGLIGATALATSLPAVPAAAVTGFSSSAAEAALLADMNRDREANGLAPLAASSTLGAIARNAPNHACGAGTTFYGRAQDMIERNYFSHQIPACGSYVWPVLQAYSVAYTAAAENIAWNNFAPDQSPAAAEQGFLASPEHRANLLGDFDQAGVGAWAASGSWSNGSGTFQNAIVYSVIFVHSPRMKAPLRTWPETPPASHAPRRVVLGLPTAAAATPAGTRSGPVPARVLWRAFRDAPAAMLPGWSPSPTTTIAAAPAAARIGQLPAAAWPGLLAVLGLALAGLRRAGAGRRSRGR